MRWLAGAAMIAAPSTLRAGEIRVWPRAEARSDTLILGEVAELRGFDSETTQKLAALTVGPAPRCGGEKLLYSSDVRAALNAAGANLADITILGASRCRTYRAPAVAPPTNEAPQPGHPPAVRRNATPHQAAAKREPKAETAATLETFLREQICLRMEEEAGRVEVRFSPACKRDLALEAARHRFELSAKARMQPGLAALEVAIVGPGGERRTAAIVAEISVLRPVVVARHAINRGESITPAHLRIEERRFSDLSLVGLAEITAALGRQPRELIRPGEMLVAKSLEDAPLVRRGDAVTIWLRRGGLTIKAAGRAQQAGKLGDKIAVARNGTLRKQDVIEAIVTGPATVTLGDEARVAAAEGSE